MIMNDERDEVLYAEGMAFGAALRRDPLPVFPDGSDHRVVSTGGWACDVCGREVNGQTDDDGIPKMDGDSVYHTGTNDA
jgi:hypothetical protein